MKYPENTNVFEREADCNKNHKYNIPAENPNGSIVYLFIKRFLDILVSVVGVIVLIIPMLIISIIIRIDSRGPALFCQERLGKNGVPFMIYKFRTMYTDSEKDTPRWAEQDDVRCTRVGRTLRHFRLDELPQLWNILVGDMSLVGPRPELSYFYDEFETYICGFKNRLAVTPGLTGLAQVNGGYDLLPEEKIMYDMEYIRTRSLWVDFKLVLKTVKIVFTHEGAR